MHFCFIAKLIFLFVVYFGAFTVFNTILSDILLFKLLLCYVLFFSLAV